MVVREARGVGHRSGVVVTSADLDGPPLGELTWPGTWIVISQRPIAGSQVTRWSTVIIEFSEVPGTGGTDDPETRQGRELARRKVDFPEDLIVFLGY
jgi:hypothetical protein